MDTYLVWIVAVLGAIALLGVFAKMSKGFRAAFASPNGLKSSARSY
jgi:hypothetical protein